MKAIEKELKSCPFCGGEAVLKFEPYYSYVKCKNCGAETGLTKATPCICAADEAAKAWNMRVGEPAAEVKHGYWKEQHEYIVCSVCGRPFDICSNDTYKFRCCPNCGARMDGDGK